MKQKKWVYDLIGVFAILLLFKFYKPQAYILNSMVFNLAILLLFIGVFKGKMMNYIFTRKFIYTIGGMCYSIYLIHYVILHLMLPQTVEMFSGFSYKIQLLIQAIIHIPIVLMISSVFFILFERPFMDKDFMKKLRLKFKQSQN
jgi:peptidoglycan/LPS O-acetylase OafA/YrhL